MSRLVAEVEQLRPAAVERARSIDWIKPPDHLGDLVDRVRNEYSPALDEVHGALRQRLDPMDVGDELGAFLAASELALIAEVWRAELSDGDSTALREPWDYLLSA